MKVSGSVALSFLFVSAGMFSTLLGEETGFIQVKCAPGVQIFLDGNLKGITNADVGGLIIQNVKPGRHEIRALKPGFQAQTESLDVAGGQVASFEVRPFVPKLRISEEGEEHSGFVKQKVGSLQIQSLPIECRLTIQSLGVTNSAKSKDRWKADGLPIGKYSIEASALGKRLTHQVEIFENDTAEIFFNFVTGKITDPGAARRATELAEKKERDAKLAKLNAQARKLGITFPAGWSFVPIQQGTFSMGSPANESNRDDDERQHKVTLTKALWMSAWETTQEQYEALTGRNPSKFKGARRPVEMVSWDDAQDFIGKLNERERKAGHLPAGWSYSLPTESEWEYACRAGTDTAYSFGNGSGPLEDYAWYGGNSGRTTHEVGKRKPNAWGLYDIHGNVWEWCSDWKGDYPLNAVTDPKGPDTGGDRVIRGGSWFCSARGCRSANRSGFRPTDRIVNLGFRVALKSQR